MIWWYFIFQKISTHPVEKCMILVIFLSRFIKKKKIQWDKFIDNSFTHFGTSPEEILPDRLGVCLLSSTCHVSWVSPTSQGVAKWQLPMSAKMKPREEKKKNDRSKFHTPKYIKVTPVSIASKLRIRNCSFLQLRVRQWSSPIWIYDRVKLRLWQRVKMKGDFCDKDESQ